MASIIWTDVLALAPEVSTATATAQTYLLAFANDVLAVAEFGGEESPMLRLARIYLTAHYATVSLRGVSGAAGAVTSESGGGLSISYGDGALSLNTSGLGVTAYGQAYLTLVRMSGARVPVVV